MSLTSWLYRAARLSADVRAVRRGPQAVGERLIRKAVGRAWGRSGVPRWPRIGCRPSWQTSGHGPTTSTLGSSSMLCAVSLVAMAGDLAEAPESLEVDQAMIKAAEASMWLERELERRGR